MPVTAAPPSPNPRKRRSARRSHAKPELGAAIFVLVMLLAMFGLIGLAIKYPGDGPPADYDPTTDMFYPGNPLSPLNPLNPYSPFNPINSPGMP